MAEAPGHSPRGFGLVSSQRAGTLSGVVVIAARFMWTTLTGAPVSAHQFSAGPSGAGSDSPP